MATIIQPPDTEQRDLRLNHDGAGGGNRGKNGPDNSALKRVEDFSPEPSRTGIWVALAAITMSFAAFTSALVVRQSTGQDWRHLTLPPIVYANTLVLLASSVTLEVARRRVASFARGSGLDRAAALRWLIATLSLGVVFVLGQYLAWRQLRAEGLYLASNPNSSFFYVLTAVHALHVLGGLGGLSRVIYKLRQPVLALRRSTMDATSCYWHFMGILWLYVLLVMWIKL
jgi:cytochrome c oxidase subunit III